MTTEQDVLGRIKALTEEEHELRQKAQQGSIDSAEEHERLKNLEVALDQCWDLLRQRRALRVAGGNPDEAQARPGSEVEGYLQ
ncbi:DUF2630 family protein [Labedaea rhizosphaerae]|uniref:Uncharacterized protein DUF2630 n=1 Tax=Labedaea rhizosphaerae TaxID=598644 RepID=A0A4V3D0B4_LABRH|nr:DUF2630 family protein [Labedaea rhizosphaerae]TDQ05135.1 uncharacterized protein DUF2630 [Labedaea rhizosphaerae]